MGLTERTFFRHFTDKREVLFHGQDAFAQAFLDGLAAAPTDASALFPDERRPYSRLRQSVIDQNPALQERELLKLAHLATTLAAALRARGVNEPKATLAAQSGVSVFGVAFTQWIGESEERALAEITDDVLGDLLSLADQSDGRS